VKLMFKNLDIDSDTKVAHAHSGIPFIEVPLANLFKKNYGDEGFYSGEEADLINKEHSKSARTKEVQTEELLQGEPETLGTTPTIEVSTITPIFLEALSNQSNHNSKRS
jgi:hypothetical protein